MILALFVGQLILNINTMYCIHLNVYTSPNNFAWKVVKTSNIIFIKKFYFIFAEIQIVLDMYIVFFLSTTSGAVKHHIMVCRNVT
jgi:hypothetical protein